MGLFVKWLSSAVTGLIHMIEPRPFARIEPRPFA